MKQAKVNLNNYIHFKLTAKGIAEIVSKNKVGWDVVGITWDDFVKNHKSDKGSDYFKMLMWQFIDLFGGYYMLLGYYVDINVIMEIDEIIN